MGEDVMEPTTEQEIQEARKVIDELDSFETRLSISDNDNYHLVRRARVIIEHMGSELDRRLAKAQAWDAHVDDVKRWLAIYGDQAAKDDAKQINLVCERYGLESPF